MMTAAAVCPLFVARTLLLHSLLQRPIPTIILPYPETLSMKFGTNTLRLFLRGHGTFPRLGTHWIY